MVDTATVLDMMDIEIDVYADVPNAETTAALREAERIARDPNVRRYSDVEEALRELKR